MAKGIKGITIEIGGNTAPLDKALSEVNKNSRSLQVELRQVEKLLKLDPTNVELLAQKQELLSKSVETTEEKLNALKAAQAQVQAQFENGDIGEEQYRAFQREVAKTEQELNNIKSSLQNANRNLNEFGDNNGVAKEEAERLAQAIKEQNDALEAEKEALRQAEKEQQEHAKAVKKATEELEKQKEELFDTAKTIGTGVLAIGTATVAGAGYAVKISTEFDKAFNTLINRIGAGKEEFDSLNQAMENVYKNNFGESIEDVAQSMATVKVNTNLAGEELQKTTENALLLRDTFEFDVNESTRAAKMMMEQFGLTSTEAYNLIAQGAQMGLDKNGDLLDTINEYSVHFFNAGYSAEEMFNSLKNGTEAGTFSVDKLGDAVKEFGIRMKDGSASDALKELGLNVDDVTTRFAQGGEIGADAMGEITDALFTLEDPLKQNELGVSLFGTTFEDLGAKGVGALMYIGGEADRTSNTLENINKHRYDDIGSALAGLGRILEVDVIEPLGDELKPTVEEFINYVQSNAPNIVDVISEIVNTVKEFVTTIVDNSALIIGTITTLATSFAILKGVIIAEKIFLFAQGIIATEGALKLATVATKLFNSAWLGNPLVWVGALIAGLVTSIILLWNTNEGFRNTLISAWESIKQAAEVCWCAISTFFTETIPAAFNSFISFIQNNWQGLLLLIVNPFAGAFKLAYDNCEGFRTFIDTLVTNILDTFQQWGDNVSNFFTSTIPGWIESITNWFAELPGRIASAIGSVLESIANWGAEVWTYFSTNIPLWIEGVVTWFNELPGKIGYAIGSVLAYIVNWGVETWNYFSTNIPIWIEGISNWFSELPGRIWTWLTDCINKVIQWGSDTYTNAQAWVNNTINSVSQYFSELGSKIWTGLSNAIQKIIQWGSDTYNNAKSWVNNTINSVSQYFSELPNKIWTHLSNAIDKVIKWGSDMATKAKKAVDDTIKSIINGFKNLPSKMEEIGRSVVKGIWNGITNTGSWLYGQISSFASNIVKGFKDNLKINSPSKVMRDIVGTGIVEGIVDGMMLNEDQVKSATKRLSNVITDEISKIQKESDKNLNLLNSNLNKLKEDESKDLNAHKYKEEDTLKKLKYEEEDTLDKLREEKEKKLNGIKDENRKKAIQKEYEDKEKALKREYEAKTTTLKRENDAIEESIKKEYDSKEKALKHKIDLIKEETKKKIDELKLTEKAIEEQLKKELEDRKNFIKEVNDLAKELVNSLKAKYEEEYKAQEESIKNQISNLDKWKDESIKRINSVYDAKIEAIDNELKAIEDAQKQKDREDTDKQELDNITKIQEAIKFEHDDINKKQLEKELEKALDERNKRLELQKIEDKKEELKKHKEDLEVKKKNEVENINEIYENEKEVYENRLEESKKFYEQRIEESKLQAEAEKLIMDKNQKEIVELLNSYSKDYEKAGMTLGDKLLEGFKPAIENIKSLISSINVELNNSRDNALAARSLNSINNSRTINNTTNKNYNLNVSNTSNSQNGYLEREFRNLVFSIN